MRTSVSYIVYNMPLVLSALPSSSPPTLLFLISSCPSIEKSLELTLFKVNAGFHLYTNSYLGHAVKDDLDNLVQSGSIRVVYLINTITIS